MVEYISFDEARRSGKRITHKFIDDEWFELDELFQHLGDIFSSTTINQMLDSNEWVVEE